jgi:hypothetical protein
MGPKHGTTPHEILAASPTLAAWPAIAACSAPAAWPAPNDRTAPAAWAAPATSTALEEWPLPAGCVAPAVPPRPSVIPVLSGTEWAEHMMACASPVFSCAAGAPRRNPK